MMKNEKEPFNVFLEIVMVIDLCVCLFFFSRKFFACHSMKIPFSWLMRVSQHLKNIYSDTCRCRLRAGGGKKKMVTHASSLTWSRRSEKETMKECDENRNKTEERWRGKKKGWKEEETLRINTVTRRRRKPLFFYPLPCVLPRQPTPMCNLLGV